MKKRCDNEFDNLFLDGKLVKDLTSTEDNVTLLTAYWTGLQFNDKYYTYDKNENLTIDSNPIDPKTWYHININKDEDIIINEDNTTGTLTIKNDVADITSEFKLYDYTKNLQLNEDLCNLQQFYKLQYANSTEHKNKIDDHFEFKKINDKIREVYGDEETNRYNYISTGNGLVKWIQSIPPYLSITKTAWYFPKTPTRPKLYVHKALTKDVHINNDFYIINDQFFYQTNLIHELPIREDVEMYIINHNRLKWVSYLQKIYEYKNNQVGNIPDLNVNVDSDKQKVLKHNQEALDFMIRYGLLEGSGGKGLGALEISLIVLAVLIFFALVYYARNWIPNWRPIF